jgi:hypothetical protein
MSHLTQEQLDGFRERLLSASKEIDRLLEQTEADTRPVDMNESLERER